MLVIVGFVSQKGGVGKSTLARALAVTAAAARADVKIADLHLQQETVTRWEERREEYEAGPPIVVERHSSVADAIHHASQENQLLIVDTPPRVSKGTLELAQSADLVVQPTGAGLDDLDPAILLFHELTGAGISRHKLVMALCRVASEAEEDLARQYVEKAGYAVLPGSMLERSAYREAHNRGQAVTETPNKTLNSQASELIQGLLGMITERVKERVMTARKRARR